MSESARTHELKSWTYLFDAVIRGVKHHDIRNKTERDYHVGDVLHLKEFDQVHGVFTGRDCWVRVTYITSNMSPCALSSHALDNDYAVLSIERIDEIHERASINDKASLEAGLQAEASPAGTGSRTLADREARSNGEAVSAVLPTNQPGTATETMGGTGDDCSFGNRGVWPPQGGASSSRALNDISAEKVVTAGETAINFVSILRPHCRKPGADDCGGYGSSHCHTCTEAMKGAAA